MCYSQIRVLVLIRNALQALAQVSSTNRMNDPHPTHLPQPTPPHPTPQPAHKCAPKRGYRARRGAARSARAQATGARRATARCGRRPRACARAGDVDQHQCKLVGLGQANVCQGVRPDGPSTSLLWSSKGNMSPVNFQADPILQPKLTSPSQHCTPVMLHLARLGWPGPTGRNTLSFFVFARCWGRMHRITPQACFASARLPMHAVALALLHPGWPSHCAQRLRYWRACRMAPGLAPLDTRNHARGKVAYRASVSLRVRANARLCAATACAAHTDAIVDQTARSCANARLSAGNSRRPAHADAKRATLPSTCTVGCARSPRWRPLRPSAN